MTAIIGEIMPQENINHKNQVDFEEFLNESCKNQPTNQQLDEWLLNRKETHMLSLEHYMVSVAPIVQRLICRFAQTYPTQQDIELFHSYMENIAIGLYSFHDQKFNDFITNCIKYIRKEEFDLPYLLSLWVDGADAFCQMELACYHQEKADALSEQKSQKKEKNDALLTRCFQEVWNFEIENQYKGKGQGSGCSKIYHKCDKLAKKFQYRAFQEKYRKWKEQTAPPGKERFSTESLSICSLGGDYCSKKT